MQRQLIKLSSSEVVEECANIIVEYIEKFYQKSPELLKGINETNIVNDNINYS